MFVDQAYCSLLALTSPPGNEGHAILVENDILFDQLAEHQKSLRVGRVVIYVDL